MFKFSGRAKTIFFLICILIIMFLLIKDLMEKKEQSIFYPSINNQIHYAVGIVPSGIFVCEACCRADGLKESLY